MSRFKNLLAISFDSEASLLNLTNLNPAMRKALEARKEKAGEEAAEELIRVLTAMEQAKATRRTSIRRLRKSIEGEKKALATLDRQFDYGSETGNFLPLLLTLGQVDVYNVMRDVGMDHEEFQKASKVPADWQPTQTKSDES